MRGKVKYFIILAIIVLASFSFMIQKNINISKTSNLQESAENKTYATADELNNSYEVADDIEIKDSNNNKLFSVNAYFLDEDSNKKNGIYQLLDDSKQVILYVDINLSEKDGYINGTTIDIGTGNYKIVPTISVGGIVKDNDESNNNKKITLNDGLSVGTTIHIPYTLEQNVYGSNGGTYKVNFSNNNKVVIKGTYVNPENIEIPFEQEIPFCIDWDSSKNLESINISNVLEKADQFVVSGDKLILSLKVKDVVEKAGYGIPKTSEFKVSGFKIGSYTPERVEASTAIWEYTTRETVENQNYDSENDILTFESVIQGAGEGSFYYDRHEAYITVVYSKDATQYIMNNKPTITLSASAKELVYVNEKIEHSDTTSLINGSTAEPGTKYSNQIDYSLPITFNTFDGELVKYDNQLSYLNKYNSLLYYYGATGAVAGFREVYKVDIRAGGVVSNLKVKKDYIDNKQFKEDAFYNSESNTYTSMDGIIEYTGIYLYDNVVNMLGEDGLIYVYNDDTNELIGSYSGVGVHLFPEGKSAKNIRIETTEVQKAGQITWAYIVSLENSKLKKKVPTIEEFQKFDKIASSSNLYIKLKGETEYLENPLSKSVLENYQNGKLAFLAKGDVNSKTYESSNIDYELTINADDYDVKDSDGRISTLWNPTVLIEFPDTITGVTANSVSVYEKANKNNAYTAKISKIYNNETNGRKYCMLNISGKIDNDILVKINFTVSPDSSKIVSEEITSDVITTFLNTTYDGTNVINGLIASGWMPASDDRYDIDKDGNDTELVPASKTNIHYTEPVGITTVVSAKNDEELEISNPGVLNIVKGTSSINITDSFYNFGDNSVKNLRLVGRIPYINNKFSISGNDMKSEYNTTINSTGIVVPDDLKDYVTVKYSTNATKKIDGNTTVEDLDSADWNWTTTPSNWNDVKAYMIQFNKDYEVVKKTILDFSYTLNLPQDLKYGQTAYTSNAAIYNTAEGVYTSVESSKVGIRVDTDKKFELNLTKVKKDDTNTKLNGAIYKLTRTDGVKLQNDIGETVDYLEYTLSPMATVKKLYPETEYKLEETQAPTNYKKQNVVFTILNDGTINVTEGSMEVQAKEGQSENSTNIDVNVLDELNETTYDIYYYYQDDNGRYTSTPIKITNNGPVTIGNTVEQSDINLDPNSITGKPDGNFVLDTETTITAEKTDDSIVIKETDNIFKVYFSKTYTITYNKGEHGKWNDDIHTNIPYGTSTPNTTIDYADGNSHDAGYEFDYWQKEGTTQKGVDATVTGDTKYIAIWRARTDVSYTVEFYYQENDQYPSVANETKTYNDGTTGQIISVKDADKIPNNTGYILDKNKNSELSAEVKGDGSTVLKVYFCKTYKVTYEPGDKGTFNKEEYSNLEKGIITPGFHQSTTGMPGYSFNGWLNSRTNLVGNIDETVQGDTTYTAQWRPNIDTIYTIEWYYEAEGKYSNTPYNRETRRGTTDTMASVTENDKVPTRTDGNYVLDTDNDSKWTENINGDGSTILKVYFKEIVVDYDVNVTLKNTAEDSVAIGGSKFTISRTSTKNPNTEILWNNQVIVGNEDRVEVTERKALIDNYSYIIKENESPNGKYVNILSDKYIKVNVKINEEGTLSLDEVIPYQIFNDDDVEVDATDSVYKYVKDVSIGKSVNNVPVINVLITNPVTYVIEVNKVQSDGNTEIKNTDISISSSVTNETITQTTNGNGKVEYNEAYADAGTYTYEINEVAPAGEQYVNVLKDCYIEVKVNVGSDGNLSLVNNDVNGKTYSFTIKNKLDKQEITDYTLYDYVTVEVDNKTNTIKSVISTKVINPVQYNVDMKVTETGFNNVSDNTSVLPNTQVKIYRADDQNAKYDGDVLIDQEFNESPIKEGVYTYYFTQTSKSSEKYSNILEGKYIKIIAKVNGDGRVALLNGENEDNGYFEVYKGDVANISVGDERVTDNNITKYIHTGVVTVNNVSTIKVWVENPNQYELDINSIDTNNEYLKGINFSISKANTKIFENYATEQVEVTESPIEANTYEYYITQNSKPITDGKENDRYINVLENKILKIKVSANKEGKLEILEKTVLEKQADGLKEYDDNYFEDHFADFIEVNTVNNDNDDVMSKVQITVKSPVKFIMEVSKKDSSDKNLNNTEIEINSDTIENQKYKYDNQKISGIDSIDEDGTVKGTTKDGKVSYEETWVKANTYTYIIKETQTSSGQYVNILNGLEIAINVKVEANGNLILVDSNGNEYAKEEKYKFRIRNIQTKEEIAPNTSDSNDIYTYVYVEIDDNSKIIATLKTQIENPVRYKIAVHEKIYGKEEVNLANIPVEITSGFSGVSVLTTDTQGYKEMEESPVRANTYQYYITQLNEYENNIVSDKYVNKLENYSIGVMLYVPGDGDIKTISSEGDYTTVSYKIYRKNSNGDLEEVKFEDTDVDDFVKVKITKDEQNVCTLNVYITTPQKYNFRIENTDIDLEKVDKESANINGTKFDITAKDENESEIKLLNAKTNFETINTKELTTTAVNGTNGIIELNDILIEKSGTYSFVVHETTPTADGLKYKDKSEDIVIQYSIAVEQGTYVIKDMKVIQADRYTINENTGVFGNQTQTINVNVSDERIKGSYDLVLNKYNKFTEKLLDGAVFKVTAEQEDKEKEVYYVDGNVLSKNKILPYDGTVQNENSMIINEDGILTFKNIRIEIPEKYTIKIEELKAPDKFTKLDDVIVLDVETGINGDCDDAKYVIKNVNVNDDVNHNLVTMDKEANKINLNIKNEYFDLAIRQYITSVNNHEIKERIPNVNLEELKNSTVETATYNHTKKAQRAYANLEIIYSFTVYNEGVIDGYAQEITEYLPDGLEFVDDDFNKSFNWVYDKESHKVVTDILSKEVSEDNLIKAYDGENLSSKTIQLKLKVSKNVKLKQKLTTISEITKSLANNRKETVDRDSIVDSIELPERDEFESYKEDQLDEEYIPGSEDDDDFEKLLIDEFDLTSVKYIKSLNGVVQENNIPKPQLDQNRMEEYNQGIFKGFKYKSDNEEIIQVKQNDSLIFGINVYNEGSVIAYAEEITDKIPEGMVFVTDSEINKKYGWKMLDENKNETKDVSKAVYVVTDYLSKAKSVENGISATKIEDKKLNIDCKEVEVEFKVANDKQISGNTKNKASVTKFDDDQGLTPYDRDDSNCDFIDDDGSDKDGEVTVYIKKFDMKLEKTVDTIIKRTTINGKSNEEEYHNLESLGKIDIEKSKLNKTSLEVKYNITATNEGETSGYILAIADYIPEGFTFLQEDNPNWVEKNGRLENTELANKLLAPNESATVSIILRCDKIEKVGEKANIAEIIDDADENKQAVCDIDSVTDNKAMDEDDLSVGTILITMKTGDSEIGVITIITVGLIIVAIIVIFRKK